MSEVRVKFDKVGKIYNKKVRAVENLSFECNEGEFFAILGPSGCGKSTSLRMLAGLEEITEGNIYIKGKRVNDLTPRERNVAMSFENYGLYNMSVYDNIAYPLKIHKVPEDQIKKQVLEMAKQLRINTILGQTPNSLSSGQKQRVSIARALVRNPDVTIMDEPLSHLDARMRSNMRSIIRHIHDNLNLTTVYVTHDQIEAMTMADRILIMNNGHLQQIGTPDEVYYYPSNIFVASFVGTPEMNFINCVLQKVNNKLCFIYKNEFAIDASRYGSRIKEGEKVVLGIRPYDIRVSSSPLRDFVKASVFVVEPLGETTEITVISGDIRIKVEIDGDNFNLASGDDIYYQIRSDKIHIFDPQTTERIIPLE